MKVSIKMHVSMKLTFWMSIEKLTIKTIREAYNQNNQVRSLIMLLQLLVRITLIY